MKLRGGMTAACLGAICLLMASCQGRTIWAPAHFGFYFNQDDQAANLAYGEANSDDVGLMLQCAKGSRQVELTDVAAANANAPFVLASGAQSAVLAAKLSIDESGAALAEAMLPLNSPVLQGFRRSGVIAVSLGRSHYGLKARREERAAVSDFFSACERS